MKLTLSSPWESKVELGLVFIEHCVMYHQSVSQSLVCRPSPRESKMASRFRPLNSSRYLYPISQNYSYSNIVCHGLIGAAARISTIHYSADDFDGKFAPFSNFEWAQLFMARSVLLRHII